MQECIPSPKLFTDVIQRQWAQPSTSATLSSTDTRFYTIPPELEDLLQWLKIYAPVAALTSLALVPSDVVEVLKVEDKKVETSSAWAIRAITADSFFNRASLM